MARRRPTTTRQALARDELAASFRRRRQALKREYLPTLVVLPGSPPPTPAEISAADTDWIAHRRALDALEAEAQAAGLPAGSTITAATRRSPLA